MAWSFASASTDLTRGAPNDRRAHRPGRRRGRCVAWPHDPRTRQSMTSSPRPGPRRGRRTPPSAPTDPAAFSRALDEAAAHFKAGRLDAAAQLYRRLEREAPGDARAAYSLAVIDIRQGRLDRARRRLEAVVAAAPLLAAAQHNLGAVRQRLGDWALAAEAYGRALELRPD